MSALKPILAEYDAFLVDLWGVIHDGSNLYPGVMRTLTELKLAGKPVIFLSNAPRVSAKAAANLDRLGITRDYYREVVTSGQVARDWLAKATHLGTHYYYLGPSKDEDILDNLADYQKAPMDDADFILCTGYEFDFQPHDDIIPLLDRLAALDLPMLCVNPDLEVVKQDGTRQLCAGAVAETYAGEVKQIGKPYPEVYETCRALLKTENSPRLLAIGDNPLTDIRGANMANIDSLLIAGGVLKAETGMLPSEAEARDICAIFGITPTYVLPSFSL